MDISKTQPLETTSQAVKKQLKEETKVISSFVSEQLKDLIQHSQWFVTLTVAEIAGVAKLISTNSGWAKGFFIVGIIILFLAVILYMLVIYFAQSSKFELGAELGKISNDIGTSADDADEDDYKVILTSMGELYNVIEKSELQGVSKAALVIFGLGTLISGIAVAIS